MKKVVVIANFPEDLNANLGLLAQNEGRSEEDLILEGIRQFVEVHASPAPRIPLFFSEDPTLAERTDELLRGFGER